FYPGVIDEVGNSKLPCIDTIEDAFIRHGALRAQVTRQAESEAGDLPISRAINRIELVDRPPKVELDQPIKFSFGRIGRSDRKGSRSAKIQSGQVAPGRVGRGSRGNEGIG